MYADREGLQRTVGHLAAIERPSASEGEREAAEWIAGALRELGLEATIEEESAHGTYWIPQALLSAAGVAAGALALRGRRRTAAAIGTLAAAGIADDCSAGPHLLRKLLPRHPTWNVVADAGDVTALETLVLVAHHDAANGGLIFDQRPIELMARLQPERFERADKWPELFRAIAGAPALVAAGALSGRRGLVKLGTAMAGLSAAAFSQIGASPVVPGANDNLTGVAALLGVAERLRETPVEGVRVVLVSAGSEESFMEGSRAFLRRHAARLSPPHTRVLAVDTVGSSAELVAAESEGMIVQAEYDPELKEELSAAAADAGVHLRRGLRLSFATDALPALRAGYRAAMLGSVNEFKVPSNYHKPTDTAANVDYDRVGEAVALCDALIRRTAARYVEASTSRARATASS
jgi:Zn-dependent M28 family amino/carboxypeptidase